MSDTPENNQEEEKRPGGFIAWFAHNHVAANIIMLFLVIGGIVATLNMRAETFPSIDPKRISVTVPFPGSTPFEVEDAITSRIEEAVMGVEGVDRVTSTASEGMGSVQIELEDFADTDEVLDEVETEIDRLADFPPEDAEEPIIVKLKPNRPVITLALFGNVPEKTLKYWAEKITDELLRREGISLIDISGDREYQISIEVSEDTLRAHGLTLEQVAAAVETFSIDLPAGTIDSGSGQILLRVQEKGKKGRDFENIIVRSNPDGSLLRLKDIANIKDGFEDTDLISNYNGKRAVLISIRRSEAQDTLKLERTVREYLDDLQLPKGLEMSVWESRTEILKDRMNLLARNALLGYAMVFLVLLLFLDLKLAFWTSLGIPISFLGGLLAVSVIGLSINMITLFALIVVLGIVVDDAIVTGESIFYRQQKGERHLSGAVKGVKDVIAPVTIGVLTSVAAFAPLLFVTGTMGQILRHIPIVVISILLASLLEAFIILPAHLSSSKRWSIGPLAYIRDKFTQGLQNFIDNIFLPFLKIALDFRYAALAAFIGLLIIVGGLVRGGFIKFVFFPQIEGDEIMVDLIMPVGTPFDTTRENAQTILEAAEEMKQEIGPQIFKGMLLNIGSSSGGLNPTRGGGGGQTSDNVAQLRILLVESSKRDISTFKFEQMLRDKVGSIPGADELTYQSGLVDSGADINIQLAHTDAEVLEKTVKRLKEGMDRIEGLLEITDSLKPGKREFVFELTAAGLASGVSPAELARQMRSAFFGLEVQRIQRERSEVKVMVRYPKKERESLEKLYNMRIALPGGEQAPLRTMAKIREQQGYSTIERADGQRIATVTAEVDPGKVSTRVANEIIFSKIIPEIKNDYPDISTSIQGRARERQEDLQALGSNMLVALMLIFVLLGALLQSYIQPLVIMSVIPFGMIGAVFGHMLLGYNLSFVSLFGIVALTGVIVNDSVVLIDYFNKLRGQGKRVREAMPEAVNRRFRPILLTTMTTFFGLLPILTETSLQARFLIPMAISLAFGLVFGTLILLVLVPVLISIEEDIKKRLGRLFNPG